MRARRAAGDAASVGHGDNQPEIDQIEPHRGLRGFVLDEGFLRNLEIVPCPAIGQGGAMTDPMLMFIAAALLLAGFVKGALGLGLPTVSVGLLAVAMPPGRALALVIVPA